MNILEENLKGVTLKTCNSQYICPKCGNMMSLTYKSLRCADDRPWHCVLLNVCSDCGVYVPYDIAERKIKMIRHGNFKKPLSGI